MNKTQLLTAACVSALGLSVGAMRAVRPSSATTLVRDGKLPGRPETAVSLAFADAFLTPSWRQESGRVVFTGTYQLWQQMPTNVIETEMDAGRMQPEIDDCVERGITDEAALFLCVREAVEPVRVEFGVTGRKFRISIVESRHLRTAKDLEAFVYGDDPIPPVKFR